MKLKKNIKVPASELDMFAKGGVSSILVGKKKVKIELRECKSYFEVLDSLGGFITGDYQKDLTRAKKTGCTFSKTLYDYAHQMSEQP